MESIDLEILEWRTFNPRKDIKSPTWFALSNRVLEDPAIFSFSSDEFKAMIYIFCQASQKNKPRIVVYFDHARRVCAISKLHLLGCIKKLEKAQSIRVFVEICTRSVRDPNSTLHYKTLQDTTDNNAQSDDFAIFWSSYPRKIGKSKAKKIFERAVKEGAKTEDIVFARDAYRKYLTDNKIEPQFILHASTFMNQWADWLASDAGVAESLGNASKTDYTGIQWTDEHGNAV